MLYCSFLCSTWQVNDFVCTVNSLGSSDAYTRQCNIVLDKGLTLVRRRAIIWNNAAILSIRSFRTYFNGMLFKTHMFSLKKMPLKTLSAKWCLFRSGLTLLTCGKLIIFLGITLMHAFYSERTFVHWYILYTYIYKYFVLSYPIDVASAHFNQSFCNIMSSHDVLLVLFDIGLKQGEQRTRQLPHCSP